MYCMKCGTQMDDAAKFCLRCGTPAAKVVAPAVPTPVAAPAPPAAAPAPAPAPVTPAAPAAQRSAPRRTGRGWIVAAAILVLLVVVAAAAIVVPPMLTRSTPPSAMSGDGSSLGFDTDSPGAPSTRAISSEASGTGEPATSTP